VEAIDNNGFSNQRQPKNGASTYKILYPIAKTGTCLELFPKVQSLSALIQMHFLPIKVEVWGISASQVTAVITALGHCVDLGIA
jgi:hypothetical protein